MFASALGAADSAGLVSSVWLQADAVHSMQVEPKNRRQLMRAVMLNLLAAAQRTMRGRENNCEGIEEAVLPACMEAFMPCRSPYEYSERSGLFTRLCIEKLPGSNENANKARRTFFILKFRRGRIRSFHGVFCRFFRGRTRGDTLYPEVTLPESAPICDINESALYTGAT